jgi:hypothetical protein
VFGWAGLAMILAAALTYTSQTPFPGLAALLPCIGTAMIITSPSYVSRLLSLKPVVYIGKTSYSIYLWHWPLWVFSHSILVTVIGSVVIGSLSYELIETPIRSGRWLANNRRLVFCSLGAEALICLTGLSTYYRLAAAYPEVTIDVPTKKVLPDEPSGTRCPHLGVPDATADKVDFVLWGDSHAMVMLSLFDDMAKAKGLSGQAFTSAGIPPLLGTWCTHMQKPATQLQWNRRVVDWITGHKVRNIFIVGRWEVRAPMQIPDFEADNELLEPDFKSRMLQDDQSKEMSPADSRRVFQEGLTRTLTALAGRHVYFLMQLPVIDYDYKPISEKNYELQQYEINRILKLTRWPFLHVLGPGKWFQNGQSLTGDDGGSYYMNRDHVSSRGCRKLIAPVLAPVFEQIRLGKSER